MERILYVRLDRDGTNPYGRSMLRSLPFVLNIKQRLIENMAKATHNAGCSQGISKQNLYGHEITGAWE